MTAPDLDALEKLADEATPGPWGYDETNTPFYNDPDGQSCGGEGTGFGEVVQDDDIDTIVIERARLHDAAFIAAANPATIKALISEVRSLQARVARWEPPMMTATASSSCSAFLSRNGKGEG